MNIARLKYVLFHFLTKPITWICRGALHEPRLFLIKSFKMFILLRHTVASCKTWQTHQPFFFTWFILFRTLFLLYLTVNWNALKLRNETDLTAFSIKHFNIRLIFRRASLLDGLFRHLYDLSNFWHSLMKRA